MKRIAHVVFSLEAGGLEQVVVGLVRHQRGTVYDPIVICLGELGCWGDLLRAEGVSVTSLSKRKGLDPWLVFRLARVIHRNQCSLIHSHNKAAHYYSAFAALLSGVPLINTKHGRNRPDLFRDRCYQRLVSIFTDLIVPVSRDAAEVALHVERIPARKVKVVYNGIEVNHFDGPRSIRAAMRLQLCVADSDVAIGIVARLSHEKRHVWLIEVFAQLLESLDNSERVKLFIVGDGPMRSKIISRIEALGIGEYVSLLGMRNDVSDVLQALDVFVLTSFTEGLSIALLEAMASGLPIVATDAGGNRELVQQGLNGFVVDVDDQVSMRLRVLDLVKDDGLRKRMGAAGRTLVQNRHSVQAMVVHYASLYDRIISRHQGVRHARL